MSRRKPPRFASLYRQKGLSGNYSPLQVRQSCTPRELTGGESELRLRYHKTKETPEDGDKNRCDHQDPIWQVWKNHVSKSAVLAIPERQPVIMTVALSPGTTRMARRHVVVRKLAAVESLDGGTVIACDKTGTTTREQTTPGAVSLDGVPGL